MFSPQGPSPREFNRHGEYIGRSFVVIGGVAALTMAMAEWLYYRIANVIYFWFANVIYLCLHLSAITGSAAELMTYRNGFAKW